jgi:hypothetical protein
VRGAGHAGSKAERASVTAAPARGASVKNDLNMSTVRVGVGVRGVDVAAVHCQTSFGGPKSTASKVEPSTEPQDDGAAEDIQESAEAALAATSQGI